jgi:predicted metalloprotease
VVRTRRRRLILIRRRVVPRRGSPALSIKALALAGVVLAAGLAGCDSPIAGTAAPAVRVDQALGGVPLTQSPDVVSGPAARDVAGILADIVDFWRAGLGSRTPLTGGYTLIDTAATAATGNPSICASAREVVSGNAFYCPPEDRIVVDAAALLPVLRDRYGVGGLAASLAHEFGHAVQARIGPTAEQRRSAPGRYPQILLEAQADCAAGAFLQWAVDGHSRRLQLPPGSLAAAVAPLLDFRDAPGPSTAAFGTAHPVHGLSLDRLRFLLRGIRDGSAACSGMKVADLRLTLDRAGTGAKGGRRFADLSAVHTAAAVSVATFDRETAVRAADPRDTAAATPYGQFAQATATALATGRGSYPDRAGAACFTGAWTSAVFGKAGRGELGSWPGDGDEALALIRNRPAATWAELAAFADGFDRGRSACH